MRAVGLGAARVEIERVFLDFEAALAGDGVLALLDFRIVEFLDASAVDADQVVVVLAAVDFEHGLAGFEEMALKQAKTLGYDQHYLLDPQAGEMGRNRSLVEVMLRQSDTEKDFELHYQPQFSLPDHRLIGAEALIRWHDRDNGYILPSNFIPVAEEIGMIHAIGKWVFREAMEQSRRWNEGREQPLKIAVNLSASQMKHEAILGTLTNVLAQTRVNPGWMDLEITEGVMLENSARTQNIFQRIRELGLSIAIDDFGSGHASFGYIGTFPIQKVKLDKVLVDHLAQDNGIYVLKTIVDMARTMGIQTLAEGVETEEQLALLEKIGCDQVQGFLLGRPVRASEFERLHLQPAAPDLHES